MIDSTTEGKSRQIQPATVHIAQKLHRTQEREDQQQHHLREKMCRRPWTPEQGIRQIPSSPVSPLTPKEDAKGARKRPGEVIPLRRRRHRLADAARKT
jgi:hypothetical protein